MDWRRLERDLMEGRIEVADIEAAVRFAIEVGKAFGEGKLRFYDPREFERLLELYGPMSHLQSMGKI